MLPRTPEDKAKVRAAIIETSKWPRTQQAGHFVLDHMVQELGLGGPTDCYGEVNKAASDILDRIYAEEPGPDMSLWAARPPKSSSRQIEWLVSYHTDLLPKVFRRLDMDA